MKKKVTTVITWPGTEQEKIFKFERGGTPRTSEQNLPQGFLHLSDAIARLRVGIWGGLALSEPVLKVKLKDPKISVEAGPRKENAARICTSAVLKGNLALYLVPSTESPVRGWINPVRVPIGVAKRLIGFRRSFPEHCIRPMITTAGGDQKLLVQLTKGRLAIRESEFSAWYRLERAKGIWPSQRSRAKPKFGRPTKQTELLRNAVLALLHDKTWSSKVGIARLRRLLVKGDSLAAVPSPDTLERFIDKLYVETGDPDLFRRRRPRRNSGIKAQTTLAA